MFKLYKNKSPCENKRAFVFIVNDNDYPSSSVDFTDESSGSS
ncbi:hypothetical protein [Flavobacterium flavigenum]|nr:hypothetical protein [Flavobacterium flavigenum]